MINLELKVRDGDPSATVVACRRLGARDEGMLRQRDTYFAVASGRLKLREDLVAGSAELVSYRRPATEGVRVSVYERVPIDASGPLATLLASALGVIGVVEKRRHLFLFEHVRIHLDDVEGLGAFVELEAVLPEGTEVPAEEATLARVMRALDLDTRPAIATGYLELLTG